MRAPLQVTFHEVDHSDALEEKIRRRADKLERHCDRLTSCRVVVAAPHRQHHKGNLFAVRIDMVLPGAELVVNMGDNGDHSYEDAYVAVRDAFDAAERQLEDHMRKHR